MKTTLLVTFTILCQFAFAQPKVITFGGEDETNGVKNPIEKNAIKISVIEILSGDFPIYYERALNDYFSAEVSAGITFGDYFEEVNGGSAVSILSPEVSARFGYSFSAAIRFYPFLMLDGFYVSPEFKFRKYNWNREVETFIEEEPYIVQVNSDESRVYSMPRLTMGYTYFHDYDINIDFHLGIGMNTPTEEIFDINELSVVKTEKNTKPRIHFGIKIGYIF